MKYVSLNVSRLDLALDLLYRVEGASSHQVRRNVGVLLLKQRQELLSAVLREDADIGRAGIALGQRMVEKGELRSVLAGLFERNPEQRVVVLTGPKVSLQRMVNMMDFIYQLGGKSVYVKAWKDTGGN